MTDEKTEAAAKREGFDAAVREIRAWVGTYTTTDPVALMNSLADDLERLGDAILWMRPLPTPDESRIRSN